MEEKLTGNLDASAQDLEKINRHLLALLAAGTVITSSLDLQFVLNSVTQQMANLLGVPACAISELTDDGQLNLLSEYGPDGWWDDYSKPNIHIEDYLLTQQVLTERSTFQVLLSDEEIDTAELSFMKKADIKTLLMLPMIYKDRVLGLVEIMDHNHERIFPEEEITIAQLLANQAADRDRKRPAVHRDGKTFKGTSCAARGKCTSILVVIFRRDNDKFGSSTLPGC